MFKHKKSTAIAWVVGGISLAGVGIGHAVAADAPAKCTYDAQGNQTCVSKSESSYTSDDGRYHLYQKEDCSAESPRPDNQTPALSLGQPGTTHIGSVVSCTNTPPAPEGFKAPDFGH